MGIGTLPATIGGIIGIVAIVILGLNFGFVMSRTAWIVTIGIYIAVASLVPVWILLQPRDYLSSFLLYGMIGTSGIRLLVDGKVDYSRSRNLVLTSVVFVTGLSGIALKIGNVEMTGMVLACVVAMAMSLVFYILDKFGLTNDQSKK